MDLFKRFRFAPYTRDSKVSCPQCNRPKVLRRYIDAVSGTYLPDHVGICDREEKCGYKYTWWDFVRDENISISSAPESHKIPDEKPIRFNLIPKEIFNRSLKNHGKDKFSVFLIKKFGRKRTMPVLDMYKIGYAKIWGGKHCTIFWQIDIQRNIRSGKIMAYKEKDGDIKRIKGKNKPLINWIHSFHKDEFILKQCFFGEHLIPMYPDKTVIIVESEKTAVICAIVYPKYLWLSSGMLQGINDDKMLPLKGRNIILCPDKGDKAFEIWNKKCNHYKKKGYNIFVRPIKSDILEDGDDIADYVLKAPVVE